MTEATGGRGSAGQTFLVGETLYLRGLEPGDAKRASAWRAAPFPVSADRAEEQLKKEIPALAERHIVSLIACRRADDEPVGAIRFEVPEWRIATVRLHVNPALGADAAAAKAEMVRLVIPWLGEERHTMVIRLDLDASEAPVVAAAEAAGMRPAYRLREMLWRDGARRDQVTYEWLHPVWVERLGDPGAGIEVAVPPGVVPKAPVPRRTGIPDGPTPAPTAIMVGERIVLRPLEVEDTEQIARWHRQETETFFDNGRGMPSRLLLDHWVKEIGEKEPPPNIEFAITLRDGGELIGDNGLYDIEWIHRTAETGTAIYRPQHRGGGLGTEAKHLLLEYAFERLGLHMVWSWVWAPNTRSAAALRKQGYRDAGAIRWESPHGGDFAGAFLFDLLAEEWRAARR